MRMHACTFMRAHSGAALLLLLLLLLLRC